MVSDAKLAMALVAVVLFNSAMLGMITYKSAEYRGILRSRTEGIRSLSAVLSGLAPRKPVAERLGMVLQDVAADFVLGTSNGSIAAFVQNTLATNFSAIATNVSAWAGRLNATFGAIDCADVVCDHANQVVECGGRRNYCGAKGELVQCMPSIGCAATGVSTFALAVKSVADKIAAVPPVGAPSDAPAALSNGMFRLDVIFAWFGSQFDFAAWTAAAQVASNFVANMRTVDFSGCARDRDGYRTLCYDVNSDVTTVLDAINQVAGVLAPASPVVPQTPSPATPSPGTASPSPQSPTPSAGPTATQGPQSPAPSAGPTASRGPSSPQTTPLPAAGPSTQGPSSSPATTSPQTSPTNTPIPPAVTPAPPTVEAEVFTVTIQPGTSVAQVLADISLTLGISEDSIQVLQNTSSTVQFQFLGQDAGLLSQQLDAATASAPLRAALGISSIQSAPAETIDGQSSDKTAMYAGIAAGAGGLLIGGLVGAGVYYKLSGSSNQQPLLNAEMVTEMEAEGPGANML